MNEYNIFGAIVDSDSDKWSNDDLTLSDFCSYISGLNDGDQVTFVFNSPGGSVTAGVAIANKIRALKDRGIKTTAKVEGVCASISTCIACACDKIVISKGSFFMIHNCWSVVEGDCNTLRKEADLMEKMNEAILSFYRSKFNATDEQLKQWMNEETWISSDDVSDFGLICEIDDNEVEFKIAASINRYDFKHIPRGLKKMEKKTIEEIEESPEKIEKTGDEKMKEEVIVKPIPTNEDGSTDEKKEPLTDQEIEELMPNEVKEKPDEKVVDMDMDDILEKLYEYERMIELLKNENEELTRKLSECEKPDEDKKEMVSKEECEKRVSGMQSKMQSKINDFTSQLKAKDEEIRTVRAELSSLNSKLEEATKELTEKSSALVEKENALAMLNAGVNAPAEELPTMNDGLAKCATPKDKVEFLKSGKYVR